MSDSRYHIHVIEVIGHQPMIDSRLRLFLEDKAFITYDLPTINSETTNYSRNCIDACDFALMILGDSYGETNASGVSQVHLSYLTVKTKNKPILILIKSPTKENRTRQLLDFIDNVEQRGPQQLYYFQDVASFADVLPQSYEIMCEIVPKKGWHKVDTAASQSVSLLSQKVPTFNTIPSSTLTDLSALSEIKTTKSSDNSNTQFANTVDSKSTANNKFSALKGLSSKSTKGQSTTKQPTESQTIDLTPLQDILLEDDNKASDTTKSRPANRKSNQSIPHPDYGHLQVVSLSDTTELTYDAHAYQDSNLRDVTITTTIAWQRLLQIFNKLGKKFSSDAMHRALNDEVARSAPQSVAKVLPKAHAVSRCTVRQSNFLWIQDQMTFNGWLKVTKNNQTNGRDLWALTSKAKQVLK